jgi:hypothetical protein
MESIRKKVYSDLFLAPSVILPVVAGASAWLLSWAIGGHGWLNLAGLVGTLGGLGWMATRIIFQLDAITARAYQHVQDKELQAQESLLVQLIAKLKLDPDQRADDYLMLLMDSRRKFQRLLSEPELRARSLQVNSQFDQLFWAAIKQLDESDTLSSLASQLKSQERQAILGRRDVLLGEVKLTTERMMQAVEQLQQATDRHDGNELAQLRNELESSMNSARRAEERMRQLEAQFENHKNPLRE